MVYIADYCARRDFKLGAIVMQQKAVFSGGAPVDADQRDNLNLLLRYAGKLCHAHLKDEQKIRVTEDHVGNAQHAIGMIMRTVDTLLQANGIELDAAINKTWSHVKLRNWKANPSTGV